MQRPTSTTPPPTTSTTPPPTTNVQTTASSSTSTQQQQTILLPQEKLHQLVSDLLVSDKRDLTLAELSKKRDQFPNLAITLWYSTGIIAVLLQVCGCCCCCSMISNMMMSERKLDWICATAAFFINFAARGLPFFFLPSCSRCLLLYAKSCLKNAKNCLKNAKNLHNLTNY